MLFSKQTRYYLLILLVLASTGAWARLERDELLRCANILWHENSTHVGAIRNLIDTETFAKIHTPAHIHILVKLCAHFRDEWDTICTEYAPLANELLYAIYAFDNHDAHSLLSSILLLLYEYSEETHSAADAETLHAKILRIQKILRVTLSEIPEQNREAFARCIDKTIETCKHKHEDSGVSSKTITLVTISAIVGAGICYAGLTLAGKIT